MKFVILTVQFFIIFISATLAQKSIQKPMELVQSAAGQSSPTLVSLFDINNNRSDVKIPTEIQNYTLLDVNLHSIRQINESDLTFININLPQSGRNELTLELVEVNPFAENFKVISAPTMSQVKVSLGRHFRGVVKGVKNSIVAMSFFEDQVMGMVSLPNENGNMVIGKLEDSDQYILYQDHDIHDQFNLDCMTTDKGLSYTAEELHGTSTSNSRALTDCVRLYLEVDNDIYINKGSSNANVTSFVTGIFNQVSTLYSNEQINTVISEIVIWSTASPYNSTTSSGMLNAFTAYRQGFNGDLAQLLSYKASGGIAYVDGICRSNPDYSMSYAGIQSTYQNVPTYSWTVEVCTHEFGHLFGSQHTHACAWNGNNTAIDGCYSPEGSCANPGLPSGGGTIMSYCHLTSVGINFVNGFGTQPGNVIRSKVTNGSCLQACSNGGGGSGGGSGCTDNQLVLQIRTDNYPAETTWNIKNTAGTILYSGGPYSTPNTINNINLCLPTACFTFTINDSYGDGICCAYGSGYYNIKQGTNTLINGGSFSSTETKTFCASGTPPSTSCTDGIQNGSETGVDCGGPNCPACPTCNDGIQNGTETGIDCGGTCSPCVIASCTDGIQNGSETGVDCGGPNCPACPTCNDGIQNGTETGIDCGGSCVPCNPGNVQVTNISGSYFETGWDNWLDGGSDVARYVGTYSPEGNYSIQIRDDSGEFSAMTSPSLNLSTYDSVKVEFKFKTASMESNEDFWLRYWNGTTWTTIGTYAFPSQFANNTTYTKSVTISGALSNAAKFRFQCDASDNSDVVHIDAVIIKGYTNPVTQTTCTDGIQNGSETGVDCGGSNCPPCPTCYDGIQNGSETGIDCGGSCSPCVTASCTDGIQNGSETGVDCGGPTCPACPTCNDGIQNGSETGIDCGGSCSPCVTASCTDGIQNGSETGVDCGGPTCPACPTCNDGVQNGSETGIDCGGSCSPCNSGGTVTQLSGSYFETGWDGWIDGGADCYLYLGPLSAEGYYSIRLRDNTGNESAMTSPTYNLSTYQSAQVQFSFKAIEMETGKDFWLLYFNGTSWVNVATFVSGTQFNNNIFYTATVNINGNMSNQAKFKFQCDGDDNNDVVYIDAVIISGVSGSGLLATNQTIQIEPKTDNHSALDFKSAMVLYPNPANDQLNVTCHENILAMYVYNVEGQLVNKCIGSNRSMDVSDLNNGMYIIKVETEENVYLEKFIKN